MKYVRRIFLFFYEKMLCHNDIHVHEEDCGI